VANIKTILLVDDDQDDQLLFKEALSEADNSVFYQSACNGIDALEKLNSGAVVLPQLIFLDVNMPKMNGIDCLKELKKIDYLKDIPVLMYSTSSFSEFKKECFNNGAVDYIVKPDDYGQLCKKLKEILNSDLNLITQNLPL
jgi:Response regulator containing CheY-like receiver, AAA-type ATPase, and DNA-binding domains